MAKVLIVDDEAGMRRILAVNLRRDSHVVVEADGAADALALIGHEDFDVVLTDQKMPDGSGMDVLRAVQDDDPTTSVIFLTAVGTLELAVESMRQGAFDFLSRCRAGRNPPCERAYCPAPGKCRAQEGDAQA